MSFQFKYPFSSFMLSIITAPLLEAIFFVKRCDIHSFNGQDQSATAPVWHFTSRILPEMNEPKQDPFSLSLALTIFMLKTSGYAAICYGEVQVWVHATTSAKQKLILLLCHPNGQSITA